MYNQWSTLNPATLLGAIDIIVIEQPDGSLHCSPWHVRFGKFQIIRPLQKKIDLYVNDMKTDLPMKLGDGGEAFFVFETDDSDMVSKSVITSPVISPVNSAEGSPLSSPKEEPSSPGFDFNQNEPEALDLNEHGNRPNDDEDMENRIALTDSNNTRSPSKSPTPSATIQLKIAFEKARKITQKLNIPSKIDINGDMVLDMDGYKPNSQKNIDVSDEYFKTNFLKEINDLTKNNEDDSEIEYNLWDQIVSKDKDGNIRILNNNSGDFDELNLDDEFNNQEGLFQLASNDESYAPTKERQATDKTYFKTLRLTSEQLQKMNLHYGENKLRFKLNQANSQIESNLYLWKANTPIVISDIDGTITKSDALGHVLTLIGRDWTHPGVANLFQDIKSNGYNIIYLTARSVGQADSTRQYLKGISQDGGIKLPHGPVILSPDRTMAALRREVILKKPEVFKMSCLNDIKSLYFSNNEDDERTPFYAGFGNRITDAISYRSVQIPSHRIFTINPNGEVHMELLELAGYKSSYLHIGELVDHFFPPIREVTSLNSYWNDNQFNQYISNSKAYSRPDSPGVKSVGSLDFMSSIKTDERYNDVNYWRDPLPNLSDLSDFEDTESGSVPEAPKSPSLLSMRSFASDSDRNNQTPTKSRPTSSTFTSPLKNYMAHKPAPVPQKNLSQLDMASHEDSMVTNESDYTDVEDYDEDDDDDDDYTDDGEDYEDDYEDADNDAEDDYDDDYDDEDLDHDDGLQLENPSLSAPQPTAAHTKKSNSDLKNESSQPDNTGEFAHGHKDDADNESNPQFIKASELMNKLSI